MFGHRREDDSAASEEFAQDTSTKLELPDLAEVGDLHPAAVRMDPALARFPERFAVGTSDRKRVVALGFVLFGIGAVIMILLNFNTFFGSLSQMQSGEERQPLGPMIPIMLAVVAVVGIGAGVRLLQRYSTEFRLAETNEALDSRTFWFHYPKEASGELVDLFLSGNPAKYHEPRLANGRLSLSLHFERSAPRVWITSSFGTGAQREPLVCAMLEGPSVETMRVETRMEKMRRANAIIPNLDK